MGKPCGKPPKRGEPSVSGSTAETRRTERERERRRNAAAGARRPQKTAPTEKGADAEHKTEPPTAYRHGTAPPRTFASLCVILQTAAAKNFGVTVLRRRPPHRGEPSGTGASPKRREPSVSGSAAESGEPSGEPSVSESAAEK